jgi:transmembrane sensor
VNASKLFDPEIDRQAADWFGRREGGFTPAQEEEFQRWLAADKRHAAHYCQFDETWQLLAELKDRVSLGAELEAAPSKRPSFSRRYWLPSSLAAAAVIALGLFLWPVSNPSVVRYTMATEAGGMKKLELPDGSVVRLNSDTVVTVDLTAAERHVDLQRGEAHFTVASESARPFVVSAAGHSVRAVGTAFNVALKSSSLEVLVTEGKVEVEERANAQSLVPSTRDGPHVISTGEKVVVALQPASSATPIRTVVSLSAREVDQVLAWQVKLLEFDERPLREVVGELNRYNQHQLVIADDELARREFGGTLRADNYEALVELLESRFGVIADRSNQRTVLRLRR